MARPDALGVYIHFPFCQSICPYCDFATAVGKPIPHELYRDTILRELDARSHLFEATPLVSIYFGGGTPGLWKPECIASVIAAVSSRFDLLNDPVDVALCDELGESRALEVTLEVNPRSTPARRLEAFRDAGVNRLSVGVQSLDDEYLRRLGRDHDAFRADETLAAAHNVGFRRLSFDVLFGGPGQSLKAFARDITALSARAEPDHCSAYGLIVEPDTPFGARAREGTLGATDDDEAAEMFALCQQTLAAAGYRRYEVSGYSRPGRRARHNSLYWAGQPYMGLGVGAHELALTSEGPVRRAATRDLSTWLADPLTPHDTETLTPTEWLRERLFLGLRTDLGVSLDELDAEVGGVAEVAGTLDSLVDRGLLEWAPEASGGPSYLAVTGARRLRPTTRGWLFSDAIARELV